MGCGAAKHGQPAQVQPPLAARVRVRARTWKLQAGNPSPPPQPRAPPQQQRPAASPTCQHSSRHSGRGRLRLQHRHALCGGWVDRMSGVGERGGLTGRGRRMWVCIPHRLSGFGLRRQLDHPPTASPRSYPPVQPCTLHTLAGWKLAARTPPQHAAPHAGHASPLHLPWGAPVSCQTRVLHVAAGWCPSASSRRWRCRAPPCRSGQRFRLSSSAGGPGIASLTRGVLRESSAGSAGCGRHPSPYTTLYRLITALYHKHSNSLNAADCGLRNAAAEWVRCGAGLCAGRGWGAGGDQPKCTPSCLRPS
jgi:hypothetical protein